MLTSIALSGLAVFQVLHVRELLSIRQKQFDDNVMQSLHETTSALENREAARLITENVYSIQLDSMMAATEALQDSVNNFIQIIKVPPIRRKVQKQNFKYQFKVDSMGFSQHFEFDDEAGIFHGEVINTRDVITFQGTSVKELKKSFIDSIEDYLAFCCERNNSRITLRSSGLQKKTTSAIV